MTVGGQTKISLICEPSQPLEIKHFLYFNDTCKYAIMVGLFDL